MDFWQKLKKPIKIVAPMVGNSDLSWRILSRKYGADVCYTEMVHVESFLQSKSDPQNNYWFSTNKEDKPLIIQICGNNPDKMLEAAEKLQNYCNGIDINLGCPQPIAKKGYYGAYLQENMSLIYQIVNKLSNNLKVPISCKIRILETLENTIEYAKMLENAGCSLIAVHGRTREQKGDKTGLANWEIIKKIKESVCIPVIANGNMSTKKDIKHCLEYTKCDGIMIAEPHLYNPLLFTHLKLNVLEIFYEYLNIFTKNDNFLTLIEVKSHAFKLLRNILDFLPEYRFKIGNSKNILNIINVFYDIIDEILFLENKSILPQLLKSKSYYRSSYIKMKDVYQTE
ncbi:tRNA-dihydrouridine synthase [Hamiltosporidium magnivora]|uniref:tRNA-dihydrouridine(16/17) synthase [NAD(P)(+)] n=2 Tax=Hamiltosporidium magnivora TaxID=148818 RepID=A0A4Q9LFP5_9MICR|nr:tRNA-dihydrouridine synthase [Hamiltosporidium magnivora]